MPEIREQVAQALGAKDREIVEIQYTSELSGYLVTLHDDSVLLVTDEGSVIYPVPTRTIIGEHGPELWFPDEAVNGETSPPADLDAALMLSPADSVQAAVLSAADIVPVGTVEVVLAWVGEDQDRARRALAAENERDKPRAGVTAVLQLLVDGGDE
ncbi:MAG: hypothetical protein K0Q93_2147 [Nocardioidaceae bacterium]|jgi:hypothetical protein|nr:hypothetical protein [Nocardioidaceae bacterium]